MNASPVLPFVHLNGTSRANLLEGYVAAQLALADAIAALQNVEFNGRDYYPHKEAGAFEQASEQRQQAFAALASVAEYIDTHINHVANA